MLFRDITDEQMERAALQSRAVADELNLLLDSTPAKDLLESGRIQMICNEAVMEGQLGEAYKEGTKEWAFKGAIAQLVDMLHKDTCKEAEGPPRFGAGYAAQ